ncbi:hypothetical protein MH117_05090 [Paenibacillus sp. ACRRX]|nr:hypothetical protein [Paenibacillus sp. ACRRX]
MGIPTPSDFQVGIQDISKAERNARGSMIIERIATKRKLEIGWRYLTDQQLKQLLNAVSPVFFQVDYPDPQTGGQRQGTFYAGDRTVGAMDYIDSKIRWKEIKFNVIER